MKIVSRFIEVKGRRAKEGSIQLEGNELKCARRFNKRFFMYRIFEEDIPGTFHLVELCDPVHAEGEAVNHVLDINPFNSNRSVIHKVVELQEAVVQ